MLAPGLAAVQAREAVVLTFPGAPEAGLAPNVRASGAEIGEMVEERQFLGSVPKGGLEAARRALPAGVNIEPLPPEQKLMTLDPSTVEQGDAAGEVAVEILPAAGASGQAVAEVLSALPVKVLHANERQSWVLQLDPADLTRLAEEPIVESIFAAPAQEELR